MTRWMLLVLLVSSGCQLIGDELAAERYDPDGDGVPWPDDCAEYDASVTEPPIFYRDGDGDGFGDFDRSERACTVPAGFVADATDCDDERSTVHPGAHEVCDDLDNDCNGNVDDGVADPPIWYADEDGDGFGRPGTATPLCDRPAGHVDNAADCNDVSAAVRPGAEERCNGIDDDCDGLRDDHDPGVVDTGTWFADTDGDGFGDPDVTVYACVQPLGFVPDKTDCNDADAAFFPGAIEIDCSDPNDYNCDGSSGSSDLDGDGFAACSECDDNASVVHPGADEYCDGIDNDCDGSIDGSDALDVLPWYADADQDGFGDPTAVWWSCTPPPGFTGDDTDCDDGQRSVFPGAIETCNGVDDNCDTAVDDDDPAVVGLITWYPDSDGDGWGDAAVTAVACAAPAGFVAADGDCDDTSSAVHPGAVEDDCDDPTDYNCDGSTGDDDVDGDGSVACSDCDDTDPAVQPGAAEWCNGLDDDCDAVIDEDDALDAMIWHADSDGDGFGDQSATLAACSQPVGFLLDDTDCDDTDPTVSPSTGLCGTVFIDLDRQPALVGDGTSGLGRGLAGGLDVGGDGEVRLVIGAPTAALTGSRTGAVYVASAEVVGSVDIDTVATAVWLGLYRNDEAGAAIDLLGDVTGDDIGDFIVGAPGESTAGNDAGAVYLVAGGALGQHSLAGAESTLLGEIAGAATGGAVLRLGDVDFNGADDFAVGASAGNFSGSSCGAVYVLHTPLGGTRDLGTAAHARLLGAPGDLAGTALAVAGDVDGTGDLLFLVGSPGSDAGANTGGAVHLVAGDVGGFTALSTSRAVVVGDTPYEKLGAAVVGVGDVTGDGVDDVLVGAPNFGPGAGAVGAAYLMAGPLSGTASVTEAIATFRGVGSGEKVGTSVAALDLDGDGQTELVIGAPGGLSGGAITVWRGDSRGTLTTDGARWALVGASASAGYGEALKSIGDVDADGRSDLLLGAPGLGEVLLVYGAVFP